MLTSTIGVRNRLLTVSVTASLGILTFDNSLAAEEQRMQVRIGGEIQQWMVIGKQNIETGNGRDLDTSPVDQKYNSEICFSGEAELENGITVGFRVGLEANTDESQIAESYLYFEHPEWGLAQMGDTDNAPTNMHVGAPDGGISVNDGDIIGIEAFVLPEGFKEGNTLIDSTVLQIGDDSSGKFSAFSPRFGGLQIGLSYIPQFEDGGSDNNSVSLTGNDRPVRDGFAIGLNFTNDFEDVGIEAYAGYLHGDTASAAGSSNIQGTGAGLVLGFEGFEFGGSFAWANGDMADDTSIDGMAFDVGLAYEAATYRIGGTYIRGVSEGSRTDRRNQRLDQAIISGTLFLGPGIDLVGGLFYYNANGEKDLVANTGDIESNDGFGFATGLKLAF
ncbi:MAG: porin [Hyphomicrobiales bacterium]|nr:porin [Hyphomicrobiales bacterium]